MQEKLKERPSFDQFKSYLREAVREIAGVDVKDNDSWTGIGDEGKRNDILNLLKRLVEAEYGVELVIPENAQAADTTFESIAIQLHHVYSTVYLMARINHKIISRRHR